MSNQNEAQSSVTDGTVYILTNPNYSGELERLARDVNSDVNVVVLIEYGDLDQVKHSLTPGDCLLSFATGIIVPGSFLEQFGTRAINIHPASPEYPGRDPHHFAHYYGVSQYGAVAHYMTEKVDDGGIVDVELNDVAEDATAGELMAHAERAGLVLAQRVLNELVNGNQFKLQLNKDGMPLKWGTKRSRKHFLQLCGMNPIDSEEMFNRRLSAVQVDGYKNGHIDVYGHRFRYEGDAPVPLSADKQWNDFTETAYIELLEAAKETHKFTTYTELEEDRHVLWRHDVDISMNRAHRLATIERERNVTATYFIQLSSIFYNVMEQRTRRLAKSIASMGHEIGVHFDISAYDLKTVDIGIIEQLIDNERIFLEKILDCSIRAVSFHNPEFGDMLGVKQHELAGLVNAYSSHFVENYAYASDSNGYWRHKPIGVVLAEGHDRQQILTHPVWWTREAMPPRKRVDRAAIGRARACLAKYDEEMIESGRLNLE